MKKQHPQCNTASFSSSLLDAINHSIDEPGDQGSMPFFPQLRSNANIGRAIMVEHWMESFSTKKQCHLHCPSPSTESSICSDTESSSTSVLSDKMRIINLKKMSTKPVQYVQKKHLTSPCAKIARFLNTIFSPKTLRKNYGMDVWGPIRKSKSMKETTTTTTTTMPTSKSCLCKNPSSRGSKSKRHVRYCTSNENIHDDNDWSNIGSRFIKRNIHDLQLLENGRSYSSEYKDEDDVSCSSSDLFELENIGHVRYEENLPVYGTTCFQVNQTIG